MSRPRLHEVRVKDSMGGRANIDVRQALVSMPSYALPRRAGRVRGLVFGDS